MKSVRTTVSLPQEQHQALQQIAEKNGLSISWVIRQAVGEFLANNHDFQPLSKSNSTGRTDGEVS
ncbi:ribbon-helix-helix domain-containing protein [Photobacterium alginatilyticum]|uniref:CopG family transcriptional regulator n=1 Tax=Photobacterium alginatilyticum TaxID=1775171 RepID=A0ABW9YJL5_9GAMM|nr:CopG family transcriptional regulator [Photobacterium alginatilyticum]NBI53732.1 CopG family transcriptional regulator [Photobacterium alginatilyticum]